MSGKNLHRLQIVLTCMSTLLVITSVSLIYQQGLLKQFDYQLYDIYFRWRGPETTSGKIVLVLMDDKSARELGRKRGDWSRLQTAEALTNLCNAGAEVVGLDVIYVSPDQDPEIDTVLANAMAVCNNIVLARATSTLSGVEKSALPIFQDAMIGDGFIDVPLDQDEVLRRIQFFNARPLADGSLQLLPSFALELARSYLFLEYLLDFSDEDQFVLGSPQGDHISLPYPDLLINYSGDFSSFAQISFADAVNNNFTQDQVKGKLVIIGSSLVTDKDYYTTPFSRAGLIATSVQEKLGHIVSDVLGQKEYGMACQAHAVETILSQKFITRAGSAVVYIAIAILGLLGLIFYLYIKLIALEYVILFTFLAGVLSTGYVLFLHKLVWFDIAPLLLVIGAQFIAGVVLQKVFNKKKAAMVTSIFGRYVSSGVVQELIQGDIDSPLEGQRRELTIFFSDLRNFTTMSEELGARDTSTLLNIYFDAMIPLVFAHRGTLDKLMGDAVMAFFGSPLAFPDHANATALTALDMMKTLETLKRSGKAKGIEALNVGIGLNTGTVTVGNLGCKEFMDYTIIGDAVNLASRLEGLNKVYGTNILLSEFTAAQLDDRFLLRELDLVRVKGKMKAITLYELMGERSDFSDGEIAMSELFSNGLTHFRTKNWTAAEAVFQKVLQTFPEDGPSQLYQERIRFYREEPPPPGWDGTTVFGHK